MQANIHLTDRRPAISVAGALGSLWLEISAYDPKTFTTPDSVTFYLSESQRSAVAAELRKAADALDSIPSAAAAPTASTSTATDSVVCTMRVKCARCGIFFDRPDEQRSLDGNPRCPECIEAVMDARGAAQNREDAREVDELRELRAEQFVPGAGMNEDPGDEHSA